MTNDATDSQNQAADPRFSTWLSANAGSGKTRVLTDRVARLLLRGTDPQNILCLTYTKAAASEMQNRLFKRLGEWAMLDDDSLYKALAELNEERPGSLSRARTLFARAVETPGGLKIQTIHSFCSSILRQFPLEAGVSPQFRELDEPGQKALIEQVIDQMALAGHPSLPQISQLHSGDTLVGLALDIARKRQSFEKEMSRTEIFRYLGVPLDQTIGKILAVALKEGDLSFLRHAGGVIGASQSANDQKLSAALSGLPAELSRQALQVLEDCLLSGAGTKAGDFVPKIGTIPTKAFREGPFQPYSERFEAIMAQVGEARGLRVSLEAASGTSALHDFANAFLTKYAAAKLASGALDFDDLIQKAQTLLTSASLQWVLYRLDGGIEHILVDEAQDTSPAQWKVIDALATEIIAGDGVRSGRTLFVVGDRKQSIYSFQGADARVFGRMAETFADRMASTGGLMMRELQYSFRSSTAVLSSVDTVFEGDAGLGLGQTVQHRAFHPEFAGRVDLWPLVPKNDQDEPPEWHDPVDRVAANDPKNQLANEIARAIRHMLEYETIPDKNGNPRPITAGDILILVQGRSDLFDHIIRACKAGDLPMAGADRLRIAGELAVKDLLALLSFLALQEDDLSLAAALRSPLFGWSEKQLYELAQGRKQRFLWAELRDRRDDFPDTVEMLDAFLRQVDFLRPYELLELILTRHGGRKRLLARLGPEAEDGIDELLTQALKYESDAVPSLTAFLTMAQSEDIEIKRQSDSSGELIRVMTVHGAKGLEAPVVILPDTTRAEKTQRETVMLAEGEVPVWRMSKENCPEILKPARALAEEADRDERRRLLYVAMTRAESWLLVCGVETDKSKNHWHELIEAGLQRMSPEVLDTAFGPGLRVSHGTWPLHAANGTPEAGSELPLLPDFLMSSAVARPVDPEPRSPSDLGGAKMLAGGDRDEAGALRYGTMIHSLLEHLPSTSRTHQAAARILAARNLPAPDDDMDGMIAEALANLDAHPWLFDGNTLAEVDVAAFLPTLHQTVSGTIDRLIVGPDQVVAVDFKTNAVVPDGPEQVPEGILRQMGAYLEALEAVFPDRMVILQVLWTRSARLMELPHGIVRQALGRSTTS